MKRPFGVVLISLIAVLSLAPMTAAAKVRKVDDLVVTPKAGKTLAASPVRVGIRARWVIRDLRVTLNGRDISDAFSYKDTSGRGRRIASLDASFGLRYGTNVLRVTRRHLGRAQKQTVRFRLTRARPLIGAGRDLVVPIGHALRLNARASRPRNPGQGRRASASAAPPNSPAGLGMRWTLVRKPAGSQAELTDIASGVQPSDQLLSLQPDPLSQPARPLIEPDMPGRYIAELVVDDSGTQSLASRVAVSASPGPSVPIDTAAVVDGQRGIAIGYHPAEHGGRAPQGPNEQFFPLGHGDALQVVVLDRRTLELVKAYSVPASSSLDVAGEYNDTKLVIVTAWSDPSWGSVGGSDDPVGQLTDGGQGQSLEQIGAYPLAGLEGTPLGLREGGQFSWIGVPGFDPGDAWGTSGGVTGLGGFLTPDENDNYAYLPPDPTTFDLNPHGQTASVSIGSQSWSETLPDGAGGFMAVFRDQSSLGDTVAYPATVARYQTRNPDGSPNLADIQRLTSDIGNVFTRPHAGAIVALVSIGDHPLPILNDIQNLPSAESSAVIGGLEDLGQAVLSVGGHGEAIWSMVRNPFPSDFYSLLGFNSRPLDEPSSGEGLGEDASSQLRPGPPTGRLTGTLGRDKQQRYRPQGTSTNPVSLTLQQVAVSEPSEWPYSSMPGEQAALSCIGTQPNVGLGSDPRAAYWTQTYVPAKWLAIQNAVKALQPSACPGVDPTDFADVRDELATELGWLLNTLSYLSALSQPFTRDGLTSFGELGDITATIKSAIRPPEQAPAGIEWLSLFGSISDVVADFFGAVEVQGAEKVLGTIGSLFYLGGDLSTDGNDGPTLTQEDEVSAAAGQIGNKLATQVANVADNYTRIAQIIAADYSRLKTVGTLGQCSPTQSGCPPEWQFTSDQQNEVSRLYELNAKREIWSGLFPAAFPYVLRVDKAGNGGWAVNTLFRLNAVADDINGLECRSGFSTNGVFPTPPLQLPVFMPVGIDFYNGLPNSGGFGGEGRWYVFSAGNFQGNEAAGNGKFMESASNYPSQALIRNNGQGLFDGVDPGGDPDRYGLGLNPYRFMVDNWPARDQGTPALQDWAGCGP